jgi:hypothetical protein
VDGATTHDDKYVFGRVSVFLVLGVVYPLSASGSQFFFFPSCFFFGNGSENGSETISCGA